MSKVPKFDEVCDLIRRDDFFNTFKKLLPYIVIAVGLLFITIGGYTWHLIQHEKNLEKTEKEYEIMMNLIKKKDFSQAQKKLQLLKKEKSFSFLSQLAEIVCLEKTSQTSEHVEKYASLIKKVNSLPLKRYLSLAEAFSFSKDSSKTIENFMNIKDAWYPWSLCWKALFELKRGKSFSSVAQYFSNWKKYTENSHRNPIAKNMAWIARYSSLGLLEKKRQNKWSGGEMFGL